MLFWNFVIQNSVLCYACEDSNFSDYMMFCVWVWNIFKTSSTRLQRNNFTSCKDVLKTSWRRPEDEKLFRWRRLEDVLKICLQDVLKTCYEYVLRTCLKDVLKTCLEDLLKILWRQTKYLLGIPVYLSRDNKSKCVSNKSVFHKSLSDNSKANPKCINCNSTNSLFALFENSSGISILRFSIFGEWFGVMKLA